MDGKISELRARIQGPVNSIYTTFTKDGELDWPGIRNMIEVGITGGSNVSLLTYGDSQFDFLSDQEVADLTKVLVEQARGRAVTVAATKRWWTGKAIEFARYCRDIGVDVLMMLPSDHVGSNAGKVSWYKAAAQIIPVMLVGFPSHDILQGLLDEPRVCSFKEDGTLDYALDTMIKFPDRWAYITGGTYRRHLTQWPYGCRAFFSWTSCFAPQVARKYWEAVQMNDLATASEVITRIETPVFGMIGKFSERWQDIQRGMLELNGVAQRYLRQPRRSLTDEEMDMLAGEALRLGLVQSR